jgi:adenylate cyclase
VFTLTFNDGGMPRAHRLREGETVIGRAPTCDLAITAPLMSRAHARVRVEGNRVHLRDAGSTYGTIFKGAPLTAEQELHSGDTFSVGQVTLTLERDVAEQDVLSSEGHQPFDESGTVLKRVDTAPGARPAPSSTSALTVDVTPARATTSPAAATGTPHAGLPVPAPTAERRRSDDRRRVDLGRAAADRRSGRDRRGGRFLRLLAEIGRTLVTVQPLEQILARVVDLVFEVLPAERAFLLLRDAMDQPLSARVMRNRDGSVPSNVTLSRTIVNKVMRDRVAMLAKDALYDPRLDASGSIQAMNIRSFMCAPLWNRNEVIGVLYCDNPRSKKFTTDDLEVFAALCNYAAVAIEQGRLSLQLLEETRRRERLQRYHSPGVISRILHAPSVDGAFVAQTRDVTVMFCDIVGFTTLCQHAEPQVVGELLNNFFGRMGEVIFEHDGTLDKFIGDAILAVFGAPFDQPDHATKAVSAALHMRRELALVNAERPDQPIRMRVAINSGRALTGDIGSPKRREFTVLGDVVNTAARIESSVAQPDQIVISKHTRERIGDVFQLRSLGGVTLRGRDTELEVFEILD